MMESTLVPWIPALLQGLLMTLQIAAGAYLLGLMLGLLGALAKLKAPAPLAKLASAYSTIGRSVPELLLIIVFYYASSDFIDWASEALGRPPPSLSGFFVVIFVLGLVVGAYITEILRGAFLAVPFGQIEAARALGIPAFSALRRIVLPAMVPYALGGLANVWLILIKDTALVSVVGYSELLFTAKQAAASTKSYFLFYTVAAMAYMVTTLVSSWGIHRLEKRIARWLPSQQ